MADEIIRMIDDFLTKKKYDNLDFLHKIDDTPYLERNELRPVCTNVHHRLEGLIYSFKSDLVKLETPLINMKLEIKDRLADLTSTKDIYQKLMDNKQQECKRDYVCQDRIIHWLKVQLDTIHCRMNVNCKSERNHTLVRRSVSNCKEFQCSNGECIPYNDVCNNQTDCSDKSDESPDCSRFCFNGFHCRDLRCIEKAQVCDGVPNCEDGSDEESCKPKLYSLSTCSLREGRFLCANKRCVAVAEMCDGNDDCGDNSDEGSKCREEAKCAPGCTASGGVCVRGPMGPLCLSDCPEGTIDDGGTCVRGPRRSIDNLDGAFEQIPYLYERYVGAVGLLKKRIYQDLEKAFLSCQQPGFDPRSLRRRYPIYQTSQ